MSYTDKLKVELYDEVVNEKNKQYIELTCRFRETCNDIKKKDKEIEKLNNIINELEKEFDKTIKDPLIHSCYKRISREYFDKLQELKGSNKE